MTRLIAAGAALTLALSAMRQLPVPYDVATFVVAAILLYRLVVECSGPGAARVAAVLLVTALVPVLSDTGVGVEFVPPAIAALSFPWWLPLLAGAAIVDGRWQKPAPSTMALLVWWSAAAAVALVAPARLAAIASDVETAPAAALAGIAVARLVAAASTGARRRRHLAITLAATCIWQAWLVIGTGRPARVLVPMLAAALMIAATDLLTNEEAREREAIGAALVIAMLVFGLVPGAHALVAHHQAAAHAVAPPPLTGADAPSSIDAP